MQKPNRNSTYPVIQMVRRSSLSFWCWTEQEFDSASRSKQARTRQANDPNDGAIYELLAAVCGRLPIWNRTGSQAQRRWAPFERIPTVRALRLGLRPSSTTAAFLSDSLDRTRTAQYCLDLIWSAEPVISRNSTKTSLAMTPHLTLVRAIPALLA